MARQIFGDMVRDGITPDSQLLALMIALLHRIGDLKRDREVYQNALCSRTELNVEVFSVAISICESTDDALAVHDEMLARRIPPNVFIYSALASVSEKAGDANMALRRCDQMQAGERHRRAGRSGRGPPQAVARHVSGAFPWLFTSSDLPRVRRPADRDRK
jgi:hypothetical protein